MTTTATKLLLSKINTFNSNPSSIQQASLDVLEYVLNGDDVVDPTSPFCFLLEVSATNTAAAISASNSSTRKLYKQLAQTQQDIFGHMSDKDFIGIFATGAKGEITVMLPYQQLLANAVYLDNSTNVKSVVFPRDTLITVNGTDLGICYPIQINILNTNIIQVIYDTTISNPLLPLSNNLLPSAVVVYNNTQYLQFTAPVIQYTNISKVYTLNSAAAFSQTIAYSNSFYYARAYINTGLGKWVEILTTHSPMVYDITKPTLLLQVDDTTNSLTVNLPDIYQNINTSATSIRVDIYSTLGVLNLDLSQIPINNFSAKWVDFDTLNPNLGAATLGKINDILFLSNTTLSGGSNTATIDEIRQRSIYHINATIPPIRPSDIIMDLVLLGYSTQKIVDSVTDKIYLTSKSLPTRTINKLVSTPLAANSSVAFNISGGLSGGGYNKSMVTHSIRRTTILPNAIYLNINGNISILSDDDLLYINGLSNSDLCDYVNNQTYMYSPFHYVIDYTLPIMTARPYYLSAPNVLGRTYVATNLNRNYNIRTIGANITLVDDNYILVLSASIPPGISNVLCQLSYYDAPSKTTIYLNSVSSISNSVATFTFTFNTNFDINQFDETEILNMFNIINNTSPIFLNINSNFNIFYLVAGDNTGLETNFDNLYFISKDMPAVIGATQETINIEFGKALTGLYCPAREILSVGEYQKYTSVVYATYKEDIYQSGPNGFLYNTNTDGTIDFLIQHNAGDTILDRDGKPIVIHNVGDYILDSNGNVIPVTNYVNSTLQVVGITMIDIKYKLATAITTASYTANIPDIIIGYLKDEVNPIAGTLNERVNLYYAPMGEPNTLEVYIGDNITTQVSGALSPYIVFYLTEEDLKNDALTTDIESLTRSIISKHISNTTISKSEFIEDLSANKPVSVKGFDVISFLPNNYPIVTLVDTTKNFVINEKLIVLPDSTLEIKDTVLITFKKYE